MTNVPDDHIDPYESRLARRVGDFADGAVRPIDPMAIAAAAHAGARRQTLAGRLFGSTTSMARLGVVLAGALVAAAAFGVYINAGGSNALGPNQSSAGPVQTPTAVPGAVEACAAGNLAAEISSWEGAAGHRIAGVDVRNTGSSACALPRLLRPALVSAKGQALIIAPPESNTTTLVLPAGGGASTMVDMANYCGPAPDSELNIRLYLPDQTSTQAAPTAKVPTPLDPPPCNGPTVGSEIQMQPFEQK